MVNPSTPPKVAGDLPKESPTSLLRFPSSLPAAAQDKIVRSRRTKILSFVKPEFFAYTFLAFSALYCFAIGRDRYKTVSEFVIQQAAPLNTSSSSVLSGTASAPQVMSSLVDGQYLQVYLTSPNVMKKLYPKPSTLEGLYQINPPDIFTGLAAGSSIPQQLAFYRKQISIAPQPLTGSVIVTTNGFQPDQALELNKSLLVQSRRFINEVNQSINKEQNLFALKEVEIAQANLKQATQKLEAFQEKNGKLNVATEQAATSSFISVLESRLVDLKVEEAALRRQYRDPDAPEVSFVADQVSEMEAQIREERQKSVSDDGRDLNSLAIQEAALRSDVDFDTKALQSARLAADNSRRESQRQLKYVVMLSQPQKAVAPDSNWRWQAFLGSIGIVVVAWGVGGFLLAAMKKS